MEKVVDSRGQNWTGLMLRSFEMDSVRHKVGEGGAHKKQFCHRKLFKAQKLRKRVLLNFRINRRRGEIITTGLDEENSPP